MSYARDTTLDEPDAQLVIQPGVRCPLVRRSAGRALSRHDAAARSPSAVRGDAVLAAAAAVTDGVGVTAGTSADSVLSSAVTGGGDGGGSGGGGGGGGGGGSGGGGGGGGVMATSTLRPPGVEIAAGARDRDLEAEFDDEEEELRGLRVNVDVSGYRKLSDVPVDSVGTRMLRLTPFRRTSVDGSKPLPELLLELKVELLAGNKVWRHARPRPAFPMIVRLRR